MHGDPGAVHSKRLTNVRTAKYRGGMCAIDVTPQ
jgi:hypothetical protein